MNLQLKVDENTTLHYIELLRTEFDEEIKEDVVEAYQLSFTFYDCHYFVDVTRASLDDDFPFVLMQGESKLFESFEEKCQDEMWQLIKEKCNEYDLWLKKQEAE